MAPFVYSPLAPEKHEIRLLRLLENDSTQPDSARLQWQPCDVDKACPDIDLIQCTIEHVSLDDRPEYTALSYTWGDASQLRPIIVDGSMVLVTVNLHQALKHLFSECHVLWVDALCINQKDNKEKSWQVEQMRLVYQYAAKAMIWLGPASDDSDGAMNAISVIGNEAEALGIQSMKRSEMIKIWTDLAAGEASPFDGPVHQLLYNISARPNGCCTLPLPAMTALLSRPWWSRIWVRQELAVASEAIFACGQQRVLIGNFAAALWVFEAHSQYVYIKGLGNDSTLTQLEIQIAAWNDTRPQYMFDTRRRFLANTLSFYPLLWSTYVAKPREMAATDPRDRVYALLGITQDSRELGIRPDYTMSYSDMCREVAMTLLRRGQFSILSLCRLSKTLPDHPSWAPNWSQLASIIPLQRPRTTIDELSLGPGFSASGNSPPSISFSVDPDLGSLLLLTGTCIGHIGSVGPAWQSSEGSLSVRAISQCMAVLNWFLRSIESQAPSETPYPSKADRTNAIWRTSIADTDLIKGVYERVAEDRYLSSYESLRSGSVRDERTAIQAGAAVYLGRIRNRNFGRRPFISSRGHIGLGVEDVEDGDLVVVVCGVNVPLLLRSGEKGKYRLVGDAYVHGVMDGESMDLSVEVVEFEMY
jgi:hypothetical protein